MKSRTLPEAEADLQRAILWYEDRREGLGEEFLKAVLATIGAIERSPHRFPRYEGTRLPRDYRRALVKRFPYVVAFEIYPPEVLVVAISHGSQRPGYWRHR